MFQRPIGWRQRPFNPGAFGSTKESFRIPTRSGSFPGEMSEERSDSALLVAYARNGEEGAFHQLVRRHLDLVYATALRKVTDAPAAEEIAQNVFHALARKAACFAPEDSLPAWLHRTALLESRHWLRGELRRRRREETAAHLGTTMNAPEESSAWRELVPLLDDALLSLREQDRAALLLRFQENKPLKEVGRALGVGEDAAQKRVQSALERVAKFFRRHGHRTATGAIAAAVLQGTAQTAPAALLATTIQSTLAVAPATALTGLSLWLAKLAGLSKAKTALACMAVAALPALMEWSEVRAAQTQLSQLQAEAEQARQQADQLAERLLGLQAEESRIAADLQREEENRAARQLAVAKVASFRDRLQSYLDSDEEGWPDDLPYVKLPKRSLKEIGFQVWSYNNELTREAKHLLAITDEEALGLQRQAKWFKGEVDRLMVLSAVEDHDTKWFTQFAQSNAPTKAFQIHVPPSAGAVLLDEHLRKQNGWIGPERQSVLAMQSDERFGGDLWSKVQTLAMDHGLSLAVGLSDSKEGKFAFGTQHVVMNEGAVGGVQTTFWFGPTLSLMLPPEVVPLYEPTFKEIIQQLEAHQ